MTSNRFQLRAVALVSLLCSLQCGTTDGAVSGSTSAPSNGGSFSKSGALGDLLDIAISREEFAVARAKVRSAIANPAFDYKEYCAPASEDALMIDRASKYICRIAKAPNLALRFSKNESENIWLRREYAALNAIADYSSTAEFPIELVPYDDQGTFDVPCFEPEPPTGDAADHTDAVKQAPSGCIGYIARWMKTPTFKFFTGVTWNASQGLLMATMSADFDRPAFAKACHDVRSIMGFFNQEFIWGIFGTLTVKGPNAGRITLTEPQHVSTIDASSAFNYHAHLTVGDLSVIEEFLCKR